MLDSEKNLYTESFELNGSEKEARFDRTNEILEGDKFWTIREIKLEREGEDSDNMKKIFQFIINDASKTLTVDQIKQIMCEEYGYNMENLSVSIIGKNSINGNTVCTNDDIIHIVFEIKKDENMPIGTGEAVDEDTIISDNNEHGGDIEEKHVDDDLEQGGESPYKEMIEHQTRPIDSDPTKTEIAITIDDGYYPEEIQRMLDVLDRKNIKATFFALGECIAKDKKSGIWTEIKNRGHQICCHTYSHAYIEDAETTELFTNHGISPKRTPELVRQREGYVKKILGQAEYDKIKEKCGAEFPRKINTALLLDTEIRMWERQVEETLGKDYLIKMKRDFPFFRFPGKVGANRPENIEVLKNHGYLSIGWTHESGKDTHKIGHGGIELFHSNKRIADNFERYLDELGIQGTQVTNIVTPK